MTNKNKKFCYRQPNFAKSYYLAMTFIGNEKGRIIYPITDLYPSLEVLKIEVIKFKKGLKNKKIDVSGVIVLKINFNKTFPLKKEYWQLSSEEKPLIDGNYRHNQFIKMAKDVYQFYNIIVIPKIYDRKTKKWRFANWLPILISSDDKKIEALIKSSDESVDITAKSIAFYSIEYLKGFDLDTGKLIEPQTETESEEANC